MGAEDLEIEVVVVVASTVVANSDSKGCIIDSFEDIEDLYNGLTLQLRQLLKGLVQGIGVNGVMLAVMGING